MRKGPGLYIPGPSAIVIHMIKRLAIVGLLSVSTVVASATSALADTGWGW